VTRTGAPEHFDVAVVGAGQAGLAAGYFLSAQDRSFVILDAAQSLGSAWADRWASLVLFTPRRYDGLPGLAFPGEPDGYPSRDEVVSYLNLYAMTFGLPVALGSRVWSMTKDGERFVLELAERTIEADAVVVATGPFQAPRVPRFAADLGPDVFQIHSADYNVPRNVPAGTVLVVGGGNTGFQIAAELSSTHEVHLSVGSHQTPLPQRFLGRDLFWWLRKTGLLSKTIDSRVGRRLSARDALIGSSPSALRRQGVSMEPRARAASGRTLRFADDTELAVDAVIWACGFDRDHSWIVPSVTTADGQIRHRRGVTDIPGLYFLGLAWQQTRGSALLGWVKDDAEYIAAQIATHRTHSSDSPKEIDAMQDRAGERDRAAHERDLVGDQRDDAGEQRDRAAHDRDDAGARRDIVSAQRDEAANQRDHAAEQRDLTDAQSAGPGITVKGQIRAAVARRDAASDRRAALADRRAAARARTDAEHDRDAGASERVAAEHDRDAGAIERTEAEHDRDTDHADPDTGAGKRFVTERDRGISAPEGNTSLDQLTGAYLPAAGFVELDREMARSRRTGQPLTLLTVDVDELQTVDEAWGHGAADRMVVEVAGTVRSSFRPYDLVIRARPDEFVCAIAGMGLADATKRLARVNAELGETHGAGWTPTTGIAELQEGDSREDVVARAAVATNAER
jgi:putative flavoprotein involved in K+ transport